MSDAGFQRPVVTVDLDRTRQENQSDSETLTSVESVELDGGGLQNDLVLSQSTIIAIRGH